MDLTGVSRIAFHTVYLSPFHFPLSQYAPLNQTDHPVFGCCSIPGRSDSPDNERATFFGELNNETDTFSSRPSRDRKPSFRKDPKTIRTVGFFGIDVDTDIVYFAQKEQFFQAWLTIRSQRVHVGRVNSVGGWRESLTEIPLPSVNALACGIFTDGVNG